MRRPPRSASASRARQATPSMRCRSTSGRPTDSPSQTAARLHGLRCERACSRRAFCGSRERRVLAGRGHSIPLPLLASFTARSESAAVLVRLALAVDLPQLTVDAREQCVSLLVRHRDRRHLHAGARRHRDRSDGDAGCGLSARPSESNLSTEGGRVYPTDGAGSVPGCRPMGGLALPLNNYGGGGIRTHGRVAPSAVFKTAPFDHSGTPPYLLSKRISRLTARARNGAAGRGK